MLLTYDLDYSGFENFLKLKNYPMPDTVHYLFRFENGLGASIEKGPYTYGSLDDQWDLKVVFFGNITEGINWIPVPPGVKTDLECENYIYCTDDRIKEILKKIQESSVTLVEKSSETVSEEVPVCQDCIHYTACLAMDDNFNMCERNMAIDCMVRMSNKDYEIVRKNPQN